MTFKNVLASALLFKSLDEIPQNSSQKWQILDTVPHHLYIYPCLCSIQTNLDLDKNVIAIESSGKCGFIARIYPMLQTIVTNIIIVKSMAVLVSIASLPRYLNISR